MEERTVATIGKNATEEYRVRLVEFHKRPFVDLRVFATSDATGERVPTKKGVAIRPDKLGAIIAALQQAEAVAREEGLIGDETAREAADDVATPHNENILAAG